MTPTEPPPFRFPSRLPSWILATGGGLWALFSLWCVWGIAPPIDLPGHAAELETLVSLLRGDPEVAKVYEWHPVFGYGLEVWLFLPLAWLTNGAAAAKTAMWLTVTVFPFAHLSLGRAFGRSDETVVLSLPLVFSMSYWWGFLSGLMAQALFLFTLAAFVRAVRTVRAAGSARGASTRRWALVMVLGLATMQSHLITFAALCVVITLVAVSEAPPLQAARAVALAVGPALAIAAPRVLVLASRAVDAGDAPVTTYNAEAHLNWFFKHYRPEGNLQAFLPAVVSGLFALLYLVRRKSEPRTPAVAAAAMSLVYLATPKTLSGILLVCQRLPSLAGLLTLHMADVRALPRWARGVLAVGCLASLGQTAWFHHRFADALDGFGQVTERPPHGRHGYLSLVGRGILGSQAIYLEHVGQWWTARSGGVGHNFFAEYDHHVVRFRPGVSLPNNLLEASTEERATFEEVIVFGEGTLPAPFDGYVVDARAGRWRRLVRPRAQ